MFSLFDGAGVEKKVRQTIESMPTCCNDEKDVCGRLKGCCTTPVCGEWCKERSCCTNAKEGADSTMKEEIKSNRATRTHSVTQISRDISDDIGTTIGEHLLDARISM